MVVVVIAIVEWSGGGSGSGSGGNDGWDWRITDRVLQLLSYDQDLHVVIEEMKVLYPGVTHAYTGSPILNLTHSLTSHCYHTITR